MADRYDWERERDRDRDRHRNREFSGGREDWNRENYYGREDWRRDRPWGGDYQGYGESSERQADYGQRGDWGRQGSWGTFGNRPDFNREGNWRENRGFENERNRGEYGDYRGNRSEFGDRGNRGEYGDYRGNRSEFGEYRGNRGEFGEYRGNRGYGGSESYSGGMGSFGGGMGSYGERGQHAGRGPKGWQRPDDRIREDINERLTDHPQVDATEIDVQVKNCEVTLTGTVDDRNAKRLAEEIAERVSGVKDVHNQLRVQPQGAGQEQQGGTKTTAGAGSTSNRK
jgi:BON domain